MSCDHDFGKTKRNGALEMVLDDNGHLVVANSYSTCLVARRDDGRYVLNGTKYSVTSSRHFNKALGHIPVSASAVRVVDVQRGASSEDLLRAGEARWQEVDDAKRQ